MKRLTKIAQTAKPSTGVLFRGAAYGAAGTREFLRRGDAYQRANNAAVKLGRRQLQSRFVTYPICRRRLPAPSSGN